MSKKNILRTFCAAALCCGALMVSAAADCAGGAVTTTEVNVRTGAGTVHSIIFTTAKGEDMIVTGEAENGFLPVYINGSFGYMSADYLDVSAVMDVSAKGYVNGTEVRMRAGAGTDSEILRVTQFGENVEITGVNGSWYRVKAGGVSGYIRSDYVELGEYSPAPEAGSIGEKVVAFAKQYLGVPYVWAGASPSGFDCSGFVSYVYKSLGYQTNRTAADIYKNGSAVDKSALQPGDAVFFASSSEAIGHVGIYIGGGEFIHASSGAGYVTISGLDESYYSAMYVGARRIAV